MMMMCTHTQTFFDEKKLLAGLKIELLQSLGTISIFSHSFLTIQMDHLTLKSNPQAFFINLKIFGVEIFLMQPLEICIHIDNLFHPC